MITRPVTFKTDLHYESKNKKCLRISSAVYATPTQSTALNLVLYIIAEMSSKKRVTLNKGGLFLIFSYILS